MSFVMDKFKSKGSVRASIAIINLFYLAEVLCYIFDLPVVQIRIINNRYFNVELNATSI